MQCDKYLFKQEIDLTGYSHKRIFINFTNQNRQFGQFFCHLPVQIDANSSEPSIHVLVPSHFHWLWIHCPDLQRNWFVPHVLSKTIKKNGSQSFQNYVFSWKPNWSCPKGWHQQKPQYRVELKISHCDDFMGIRYDKSNILVYIRLWCSLRIT